MVIAGQNVCVVTAVHPDHGTEVVGVLLVKPKNDQTLWKMLEDHIQEAFENRRLTPDEMKAQLDNYATPEITEVTAQPPTPETVIATVITMYRGHDAEMFTQVVAGKLTEQQRRAWRDAHGCDLDGDEDEDDTNNLFFREITALVPNDKLADLLNVDGPEKDA